MPHVEHPASGSQAAADRRRLHASPRTSCQRPALSRSRSVRPATTRGRARTPAQGYPARAPHRRPCPRQLSLLKNASRLARCSTELKLKDRSGERSDSYNQTENSSGQCRLCLAVSFRRSKHAEGRSFICSSTPVYPGALIRSAAPPLGRRAPRAVRV